MIFETERLILRPRTMDDFDACLAMDRARGVVDFIRGPWDDPVQHKAFIKARIEQDYGNGLGYWSIFAKTKPDHFLGWILLIPEDGTGPEIEIGWRLHPDYWGQGIASEAASAIIDHAFSRIELPSIVADIDERNMASRKLAEKLGMTADRVIDGYLRHAMTLEDYQVLRGCMENPD
ncbi:GNAT family N-acetyltransferase [Thalassospira sp. HF15]|uniref:GNAT family N-acetyltransferase n=1 Tax=Thalassospira sp. HF15 TaxID=2722755 RepID=UPI0014309AD2|nr:GNAT family N-acetyltransferase [Thalassospira sp. HF15]NIY75538.1 GNAT family N-acetyltransferase [Thalassospira sp. HF15]